MRFKFFTQQSAEILPTIDYQTSLAVHGSPTDAAVDISNCKITVTSVSHLSLFLTGTAAGGKLRLQSDKIILWGDEASKRFFKWRFVFRDAVGLK